MKFRPRDIVAGAALGLLAWMVLAGGDASPAAADDKGLAGALPDAAGVAQPSPLAPAAPQPVTEARKELETAAPAAKHVMEAAKPVVETAKPVVQAAKPVVQAAKPVVQAAKPVVQAVKPVAEAAKPAVRAAKPVAEAAKPVVKAAQPVVEAAKPVVDAVKPVVKAAQPVVQAAQPVVESAVQAASDATGGAVPAGIVENGEALIEAVVETAIAETAPVLEEILGPEAPEPLPVLVELVPGLTGGDDGPATPVIEQMDSVLSPVLDTPDDALLPPDLMEAPVSLILDILDVDPSPGTTPVPDAGLFDVPETGSTGAGDVTVSEPGVLSPEPDTGTGSREPAPAEEGAPPPGPAQDVEAELPSAPMFFPDASPRLDPVLTSAPWHDGAWGGPRSPDLFPSGQPAERPASLPSAPGLTPGMSSTPSPVRTQLSTAFGAPAPGAGPQPTAWWAFPARRLLIPGGITPTSPVPPG